MLRIVPCGTSAFKRGRKGTCEAAARLQDWREESHDNQGERRGSHGVKFCREAKKDEAGRGHGIWLLAS